MCTVESISGNVTAWLINNAIGPYTANAIRGGQLDGYSVASDALSNNLIVENIVRNDDRNGSDYRCVIVPAQGRLTLADIIQESDPTILYVADEYLYLCMSVRKYCIHVCTCVHIIL